MHKHVAHSTKKASWSRREDEDDEDSDGTEDSGDESDGNADNDDGDDIVFAPGSPEMSGEESAEDSDEESTDSAYASSNESESESESRGRSARVGGKPSKPTNDDVAGPDDSEDTYYQKFSRDPTSQSITKMHPQLVTIGTDEMLASVKIVRDRTGKIADLLHCTIPRLTKYEMTTVIGTRAEQLEHDAVPFIDLPDSVIDSYTIAKLEFEAGVLPFIIARPLPDGTIEYWRLADLERV